MDQSKILSRRWHYGLAVLLAAQGLVYALRMTDGFYDGMRHTNWSPPFYLMKAEVMHSVRFLTDGYAGFVSATAETPAGRRPTQWYASHPQFLAIPLYVWTGLFGFAEWTARSLIAFVTLLTTVLLWFAVRERHGERRATMVAAVWAALPATIVYGRNLEHEPFLALFLALAALGHEKHAAGKREWQWCWLAALIGLMWTDWPGFVFAALFFLASRRLRLFTVLGIVAGCAIVGAQVLLTVATHGAGTPGAAAGGASTGIPATPGGLLCFLWGQYYGRSGLGGSVPWGYWLHRQALYWQTNFTAVLGSLGLLWGIGALVQGWRESRSEGLSLGVFFFLTTAGTLFYAMAVRNASAVHLFYQYVYGLFVAWGLVEFLERAGARLAALRLPQATATAAWAICLGVLLFTGLELLYLPERGGPAEVKVLRLIKSYPPQTTVAAIGTPEDQFLTNPNVEYYSGRSIWFMYPDEAAVKDLVLLAPGDFELQSAALNCLAAPKFNFEPRACAPLFCLWEKKAAALSSTKTRRRS